MPDVDNQAAEAAVPEADAPATDAPEAVEEAGDEGEDEGGGA